MSTSSPSATSRQAAATTSTVYTAETTSMFGSQLWFVIATASTRPKPSKPGRTGNFAARLLNSTRFAQVLGSGESPSSSSSEESSG
eukprot:CAMPEP_0180805608 /NCGR_PEP_ID=MMETSP1038_2-20121128/62117_1 /TAXON_ID=632150 /ORGANISM="Azadinium spinosum, Strain 3D9" /LENGTH=85 /DNA_ID=CAMNT_0022846193 /DNA_START=105 /DNA_END=358 /DNA_ORIENTATION=+